MSVAEFEKYFEETYGNSHPPFFRGSIKEAMSFAFDRPAPEKLLLVVYLHNTKALPVNVFVATVLQDALISDYLRDHAVMWPANVTSSQSRAAVQDELENVLGALIAVPNLRDDVDTFPKFLIYGSSGGSAHLLKVLNGNTSSKEVIESIMNAEERHKNTQVEELTASAQGWGGEPTSTWNSGWGEAGWGDNGGWSDPGWNSSEQWGQIGFGGSTGWDHTAWANSGWDNDGWGNNTVTGENGEGCSSWGEMDDAILQSTNDTVQFPDIGGWPTGKPVPQWDNVEPSDVWSMEG